MGEHEKQNPSKTPNQESEATVKKRDLLKMRVQERLSKVDVGGDRIETEKDVSMRKEAVDLIAKECLDMPEDRLERLLDELCKRMKEKNAYQCSVAQMCSEIRAGIKKDCEDNSNKTNYNPIGNKLLDGVSSFWDREIIRDNFDPKKLSGASRSANYFEYVADEKGWDKLLDHLDNRSEALVGFIVHWNKSHPVYKELEKRKKSDILKKMDDMRNSLMKKYDIPEGMDKKMIGEQIKGKKNQEMEKEKREKSIAEKLQSAREELRILFARMKTLSRGKDERAFAALKDLVSKYKTDRINTLIIEMREGLQGNNSERAKKLQKDVELLSSAATNTYDLKMYADEKEREAREKVIEGNIEGKDLLFQFSKENGNEVIATKQYESELLSLKNGTKSIKDLNSHAFANYVNNLYQLGHLDYGYFEKLLGEKALLALTFHWGINEKGENAGNEKSLALQLLEKSDKGHVVHAFKKMLKNGLRKKIEEVETLEKSNYSGIKQMLKERGLEHEFDEIAKKLEEAGKKGDEAAIVMILYDKVLSPSAKADPKELQKAAKSAEEASKSQMVRAQKQKEEFMSCVPIRDTNTLGELSLIRPLSEAKILKNSEVNFLLSLNSVMLKDISAADRKRLIDILWRAKAASTPDRSSTLLQLYTYFWLDEEINNRNETRVGMKAIAEIGNATNNAIKLGKSGGSESDKKAFRDSQNAYKGVIRVQEKAEEKKNEEIEKNNDAKERGDETFEQVLQKLGFPNITIDELQSNTKLAQQVVSAIDQISEKEQSSAMKSLRTMLVSKVQANAITAATVGWKAALKKTLEEEGYYESVVTKFVSSTEKSAGEISLPPSKNNLDQGFRASTNDSFSMQGYSNFSSIPVGKEIQLGGGCDFHKYEDGSIEVDTYRGKLRYDAKEAPGALSAISLLTDIGLQAMIPALDTMMKELSKAREWKMDFSDGNLSGNEERRLMSFIARTFGVEGFEYQEADALAMRNNLKKLTDKSNSQEKTLVKRGMELGILDDMGMLKSVASIEKIAHEERNGKVTEMAV